MIGLQITGDTALLAKLEATTGKVVAAAKTSLDMWATELAGYIRSDKLSGDPLNRRSGRLSQSVHPIQASDTSSSISAGAGGGAGVPYAKIHEYGGLIPAHVVAVKNAQALCFSVGGLKRFAKAVQIPDVQMPERSYMRSALREQAPEGIAELRAAVREAIA